MKFQKFRNLGLFSLAIYFFGDSKVIQAQDFFVVAREGESQVRAIPGNSYLKPWSPSSNLLGPGEKLIMGSGDFSIPTVPVGDVGNSGAGRVDYPYSIGKFEITNAQYASFLNSVARISDIHRLYDERMALNPYGGIIRQSVGDGSYLYFLRAGRANKPVSFVTWLSAARFVNWLENGRPVGEQVDHVTETGTYDLSGTYFPYGHVIRNSEAKWALPTAEEWIKAAYYDPTRQGSNKYWRFATRTMEQPIFSEASSTGNLVETGFGVCNYNAAANWAGSQFGNPTSVGSAGLGSETYYGAYDMNGNVSEFTEEVICFNPSLCGRFWRGGDINSNYAEDGSGFYPGLLLRLAYIAEDLDGDDIYSFWRTGFRVVKLY